LFLWSWSSLQKFFGQQEIRKVNRADDDTRDGYNLLETSIIIIQILFILLVIPLLGFEINNGMELLRRQLEYLLEVNNKSVDISLAVCLVDDVLVVVVSETPTQLFVVHFWLVLPDAPPSGHFIRVCQLKLPSVSCP